MRAPALAIVLACLAPCTALAQNPAPAPSAIVAAPAAAAQQPVRAAYAIETRAAGPNPAGAGSPTDPKNRGALFSQRLVRLLAADDAWSKKMEEPGRLDFSPFLDGQDGDVKGLKVETTESGETKATVVATFTSFNAPRRIIFTVVKEARGWRIDEMRAAHKGASWTLSKVLTGK